MLPKTCRFSWGHLARFGELAATGSLQEFQDYCQAIDFWGNLLYHATSSAIKCGRVDILEYLEPQNLAASHGFDRWGGAHEPGVIVACQKGHLEVVKYACQNGALERSDSIEYSSSIIAACEHGHLEIVKYLHEHTEEDIRCNGDRGLALAVQNHHVDVAKYILHVIDSSDEIISAAREMVANA